MSKLLGVGGLGQTSASDGPDIFTLNVSWDQCCEISPRVTETYNTRGAVLSWFSP